MDAPTAIAPVERAIGVHLIREADVSPSTQQGTCQDRFTHSTRPKPPSPCRNIV